MLQGTGFSRHLPSVSVAILAIAVVVGNVPAGHTGGKRLCGQACSMSVGDLPAGLRLHDLKHSSAVSVHNVVTRPTATPKPAVVSTVAAVAPEASACPAGGLPDIGTVTGGMYWIDGIPNDSCQASQAAPYGGALGLWKVPPAPFDRVYYPNLNAFPARGGWPTCSWWAREAGVNYGIGRGSYGSVPRVGATIVYAPNVLGAGSDGHYGHVVQVYTNGWILTSEMNFYWNGGGASRVIFRFVPWHTSGVSFIY